MMAKNKDKKKIKKGQVIYFNDEMNDEFSTAEIVARRIDGNYKYDRASGFGRIVSFFWYRIVAVPIAFVYLKLKFRHKIVGKEKLRAAGKNGIFVYGNHTQITADALIPTFVRFPKDAFVIVHPDNVSIPFLGRVVPYMGGLPLPDDMAAARNFSQVIGEKNKKGKAIFIYPEAHIWPYYTNIRSFRDDSFSYPVKYNSPVYCFTNTYQKKGKREHPQLVTYVDGPFYPDEKLQPRMRRKVLRDEVYSVMKERSSLSDVVWIEYRRAEQKVETEK